MIPLAAEHIFSVFLTVWALILAWLWFREEYKHPSSDWTFTKEQLYVCSRCHLSFLAKDDSKNITRCPRCNEMCFLKRKKRF